MRRSVLEARGFEGFLTTRELSAGRLKDVPSSPGIYVVISAAAGQPSFLASSIGGRFKGKDPTVAESALVTRWVAATDVLYIGKADQLKRRIAQLCRYAAGEPVGHWGGRYLWQVVGCENFSIAWLPGEDPFEGERRLIEEFKEEFGCLPFANIQRGRKLPGP
jgi:hypothetical protein